MRFGFHISISGGFSRVPGRIPPGCGTLQIFPSNPRGWKKKPLENQDVEGFRQGMRKKGINPVVVHSTYLPKINTSKEDLRERSINALNEEIERAEALGGDYFIIHLGVKGGGVELLKDSLRSLEYREIMILLENTCYSRFKDMGVIMKDFPEMGLCFDTAHAFEAGHDLRRRDKFKDMVKEIKDYIGLERLKVMHLNDSMTPLGSEVDRHFHIGRGYIGAIGFINLFSHEYFSTLPGFMETPGCPGCDYMNLRAVQYLYRLSSLRDQSKY